MPNKSKKKKRNRKNSVLQLKPQFKVGDSVVVRKGTSDPDYKEYDISGWQGRIIHIEDEDDGHFLIRIEWDSITLKNMAPVFIENSERDDLLWSKIDLYDHDLSPARPRDRKKNVRAAIKKISKKYRSDPFLYNNDNDGKVYSLEKTGSPKETMPLLVTVTEEHFQPARLYYDLFDKAELQRTFSRLRCMDYDRIQDRWVWLYRREAKKLKFQQSYSKIPKHLHPLVIGSWFFKNPDEIYLDLNSYDRAIKAILFFDKYIPRSVAKVTDIAVVNKLFRLGPDGLPKHNDFFNGDSMVIKDPDALLEELIEATSSVADPMEKLSMALSHVEDTAKASFPEVERFPTHFYEDGITGLEGSLTSRAIIAQKHFMGDTDFSFYDLMQNIVPKVIDS